jgi:hypothetical protein
MVCTREGLHNSKYHPRRRRHIEGDLNMARAAINILGSTGETYDLVSLGSYDVTSTRASVGVYTVTGTFGMVPFPPVDVGWGYTINQVDRSAEIGIEFAEGVLTVTVTTDGQPYDLKHMITLHILVPDVPEVEMPQMQQADEEQRAEA